MEETKKENETFVLPLAEETFRVERHPVEEPRDRIDTVVEEREQLIEEMLASEDVVIERVPLGTIVKTAPPPRQEGDTLIIPLVEEEIFVQRRLVVREEVRVTKKKSEKPFQERVSLRREDAVVTRREPGVEKDREDASDFDALPSFQKKV
jgi:uncharacterized protein (TIGR02271 family)